MTTIGQGWCTPKNMLPLRLYWSTRSPFVRKALIAAYEVGVGEQIELISTFVTGKLAVPDLELLNPLGQLPTLVTASGETVLGSDAIIDFLDAMFGHRTLLPSDYPRRYDILRRTALAQGIKEKLVRSILMRVGVLAKDEAQTAAYTRSVELTLDALEADVRDWSGLPIDAGHIGLAAALGYMDFRFASQEWRANRPGLVAWHEGFATRPSYLRTEFVDPKAKAAT